MSDVRYAKYRTRVELDGRIGHTEDGRFRDMRRDNAGTVAGDGTLRYGWADVEERACESAAQVVIVLRGRGWTGTPRRCGPNCRLPLMIAEDLPPRGPVPDPSRSRRDWRTSA